MIPRWIPQQLVSVELLHDYPHVRAQIEHDYGIGFVCTDERWLAEVWVPKRWLWYARVEFWYYVRSWWLYRAACQAGFLVVDEGDYYSNGRWTLRFWQRAERRAYRVGFREAMRQADFVFAGREKAEYRRGRRDGFYLGINYQHRYTLRRIRELDIRRELEQLRDASPE